ncbi:type VI secretion protein [Vibrio aquaticus]|uniref:Type VI secretion protein n=1 Tax=Vibrio aquaticus TaxID=2496559 RepID=A0A3S0PP27_9VIBR|nr:type VI secretion system ImpA family N-terminal domain-containing protein [Vibrio aquaticus]RTZ16421.1 type VI secretion protein [Vibrio aquaticus]
MSNSVLLERQIYTITNDSKIIRNHPSYQKVRDEINGRNNPLTGGTSWNVVLKQCEQLASGPGLDLMMSGYLTLAKLKVEGISGYADGLELLMRCLTIMPSPDVKSAKMRKELLDWVNHQSLSELKSMRPTYEQLKDLYRSEQLCGRIYRWLEIEQPQYLVDYETIGFILFEHVDRIETQFHTALKQNKAAQHVDEQREKQRFKKGLTFGALLTLLVVGAASFGFVYFTSPHYLSVVDINRQQGDDSRAETQDEELIQQEQLALAQTDKLVERFLAARTKMANLSLLSEQGRWAEISKESKAIENYANSLSPIYGRLTYVESLIETEQWSMAHAELDILVDRLDSLGWAVASLKEQIEQESSKLIE